MCQTLVFAPQITTAFIGAHGVFKIIDRQPLITSINKSNTSPESEKSNNISFRDINFRYPTRPNMQVLEDFNLNVGEGKTVALVGHSGRISSCSFNNHCKMIVTEFHELFNFFRKW